MFRSGVSAAFHAYRSCEALSPPQGARDFAGKAGKFGRALAGLASEMGASIERIRVEPAIRDAARRFKEILLPSPPTPA